MSNVRSSRRGRVTIQDSVRDDPTKQGSEVKPDTNKTTDTLVFEPVPEMRNSLDVLLLYLKEYWIVFSLVAGASFCGATFLKFRSDLVDAHVKIVQHGDAIERQGAEDMSLDRRLIKAEKNIEFIGRRLSSSESDVRDLKELSRFLERQQAILSDRSERSLKSDKSEN